MKKIYLLLFLLAMLVNGLHAQKNLVTSFWDDSLTKDGNHNAQQRPLDYYDSRVKIQYAIVNDGRFLYLRMRVSDETTQLKIIRGGMSIYLDIKGGKKRNCAIHYPLPTNAFIDLPDPTVASRAQEMKTKGKPVLSTLTIPKEFGAEGLFNIPNGNHPLENLFDVKVSLAIDTDNNLIYDLKVPFGLFFKESVSGTDTIKPLALGIVVNGLNLPHMNEMEGSGEGGGGMGGGPPGGGMGGGPPGGGMSGGPPGGGMGGGPPSGEGGPPGGMNKMLELTQSQETWVKFRLAFR